MGRDSQVAGEVNVVVGMRTWVGEKVGGNWRGHGVRGEAGWADVWEWRVGVVGSVRRAENRRT